MAPQIQIRPDCGVCHTEFETHMYTGTGKKSVCGGRWWVCKPILVFYFGPNQAFDLGLSRTTSAKIYTRRKISWMMQIRSLTKYAQLPSNTEHTNDPYWHLQSKCQEKMNAECTWLLVGTWTTFFREKVKNKFGKKNKTKKKKMVSKHFKSSI